MSPVVAQCVNLEFFCGTEHTAMSSKTFDKLGGALQDAVMESAYLTQVHVQAANEASLVNTVGFSDPQLPNTLFAKNGVRVAWMRGEARREAEEMCSPEFQPKPWEQWRERLNNWSGGSGYVQVHLRRRARDSGRHIGRERRAPALVEGLAGGRAGTPILNGSGLPPGSPLPSR